jgi:osmotically-inducible protein OsmY
MIIGMPVRATGRMAISATPINGRAMCAAKTAAGSTGRATRSRPGWGDHDAQHRREADDRGAHRGRGPKGYRRSDERIRDDVNDRLTDDAWLDASHVEVAVENGDVTLSGTVADRPAKRRAELLAEAVSGVGNVQNNLRVDLGGETSREAGLAGGAGAIVPPIRDPLG